MPVLHRNSANLMQGMLDEVKTNLTVIPELKALIPPLQANEFEQLKNNILKDGCREPLLVWQTTKGVIDGSSDSSPLNVLIDGHNRYEICRQNGIDFKIALRQYDTMQAVRDFMIDNQLGRRNLTPEQMSYLRGLKYRNVRQSVGRPVNETDKHAGESIEKHAERTRDKMAKEFNVSPRTILRDRDYSAGIDRLDPDLKQDVLKGTHKLPKELVREIGRTMSTDTAPLTLSDVLSITPVDVSDTVSSEIISKTTAVDDLVQQITQLAGSLDPAQPAFISTCDQLISLLKQAKKQRQ